MAAIDPGHMTDDETQPAKKQKGGKYPKGVSKTGRKTIRRRWILTCGRTIVAIWSVLVGLAGREVTLALLDLLRLVVVPATVRPL